MRFKELNQLFDEVAAGIDDPIAQLTELGRAYYRFAVENPEHYRMLMMTKMTHHHDHESALGRPPQSQGDAAFFRLMTAVQRCIDAGAIRDADPVVIAVTLWSGLHGLVSLLITAPEFPWPNQDELSDFVIETQIRGLLA